MQNEFLCDNRTKTLRRKTPRTNDRNVEIEMSTAAKRQIWCAGRKVEKEKTFSLSILRHSVAYLFASLANIIAHITWYFRNHRMFSEIGLPFLQIRSIFREFEIHKVAADPSVARQTSSSKLLRVFSNIIILHIILNIMNDEPNHQRFHFPHAAVSNNNNQFD